MFIQMVSAPCTKQDDMRALVDNWCAEMSDRAGWLGGTYGFTDDDRFVGVVRFEDSRDCELWCQEPEAGAWWAAAEELCSGAPEIHQSGDVSIMLGGGSDTAGFVQVMHGKVGNADVLRHMTDTEMTSMLEQARPEIIGATLIFEDDGTFTETVAFTDEESARRGEATAMPDEMAAEWSSAATDVEYLDLHHPWFASHR